MKTPVIYLDLDGTLNAWKYSALHKDEPDVYDDFEWHENILGYDLCLSRKMADDLRSIQAEFLPEILWVGEWEHSSVTVGDLVGLPEWDYLPNVVTTWGDILEDQIENPRPFIWITGELYSSRDMKDFDKELEIENIVPPKWYVSVCDATTGLLKSEVAELRELLQILTHNEEAGTTTATS